MREIIVSRLAQEVPKLVAREIKLDESYFGEVRKDKRERGAGGQIEVFGLLKHNGKVVMPFLLLMPERKRFFLLSDTQ